MRHSGERACVTIRKKPSFRTNLAPWRDEIRARSEALALSRFYAQARNSGSRLAPNHLSKPMTIAEPGRDDEAPATWQDKPQSKVFGFSLPCFAREREKIEYRTRDRRIMRGVTFLRHSKFISAPVFSHTTGLHQLNQLFIGLRPHK